MKYFLVKRIAIIVLLTFFSMVITPNYSFGAAGESTNVDIEKAKQFYIDGDYGQSLNLFKVFIEKNRGNKALKNQLIEAYYYEAKIYFLGDLFGDMEDALKYLFKLDLNYKFPDEKNSDFLKKAYDIQSVIEKDKKEKEQIEKEKLEYKNKIRVKHLLSVLYHDVGLARLKENISKAYSGLQIAVSYGCHALRPSAVTEFDDPVSPKIFDELVEATGAFSVEWARKLDCCGAPLTGINDRLAEDMARKKIESARQAGAQFICTACPYTQLQLDGVQMRMAAQSENSEPVAPVLYPQLLGLCMGIDQKTLGISKNEIDLSGIISFLMAE